MGGCTGCDGSLRGGRNVVEKAGCDAGCIRDEVLGRGLPSIPGSWPECLGLPIRSARTPFGTPNKAQAGDCRCRATDELHSLSCTSRSLNKRIGCHTHKRGSKRVGATPLGGFFTLLRSSGGLGQASRAGIFPKMFPNGLLLRFPASQFAARISRLIFAKLFS